MESVVVVVHLQRTDRGAITKGSDWVPNLLCLAVASWLPVVIIPSKIGGGKSMLISSVHPSRRIHFCHG